MEAWPMPEMQMQVNQLREAFSADVNRPFELKRGFPFESPSPSAGGLQPSPPLDTNIQHPMLTRHESLGHQTQMPYHTAPITPPISSAGLSFEDSKDGLLMSGSMQMMASSQQQSMPMHTTPMSIGQEWNPTPIIAYVSGAPKLQPMLTEVIVSGTMHSDRRPIRQCRVIYLYLNSLHKCILPQVLLNRLTPSTSNRRPIPCTQACHLYPGIKQRHSCLSIRLQRLPSSHQACGETPSLAHMILPETSDAGIWKRTGRSRWTILSRKRGRSRPRMRQHYISASAGCTKMGTRGVLWLVTLLYEPTNSRGQYSNKR